MNADKGKTPLHRQILIGLVVGIALGMYAQALLTLWPSAAARVAAGLGFADWATVFSRSGPDLAGDVDFLASRVAAPLGQVFLRLVMMVVIPLIFAALCLGVCEIGDVRQLGRIGLRTLAITAVFSLIAVAIGIALVNTVRPGAGLDKRQQQTLQDQFAKSAAGSIANAERAKEKTIERRLLDLLPENPLQEAVGALDGSSPGNGMLAVMIFALLFGIGLSMAGDKGKTLLGCLEGVFAASMAIIGFAMRLAPYAVACLMFAATARLGVAYLQILFWFVLTALLGLAIHFFVVYSLALRWFGKDPIWFFKNSANAIVTAFATSSSNATLPVSLRVAQENLGLPPKISQFVLTVGATGNQNGTALYEGVVVLFLAQVFGVELSALQQFTVVLMAVLAGIGTAGVPGGSLPLIVGVLQSVNVPGLAIALILGVDRILDMARTAVNVVGDLVVATCVAAAEPESSGQ